MSKTSTTPELEQLAAALAQQIKTEKDLGNLTRLLRKTAIEAASKKWTMPIHHWPAAMNRFMIEFPGRMPETM